MRVPESRRGGVLFGLLASVVIVVCVLTFTGIYVARSIRVSTHDRRDGSDVSIDLPGGHFSVRAHEKAGAVPGIPPYPGARMREDSGGNAVFEWSSNRGGTDKGFAVSAQDMITDDSVQQVEDFYRKELPDWRKTKWSVTKNGREVQLEFQDGAYKRVIGITSKHDGTHIGVASFGQPAAN
jgi:hypothetical protein